MGLAPSLPLALDDQDGFKLIQNFRVLTIQNLKMILLTSPGERVMDPLFGVGLRRFLFEPLIDATEKHINAKIQEQVNKYLPHISILGIRYTSNESRNMLSIHIRFKIVPINVSSALDITF